MTKPIIRIHNQQLNEVIDREMTDEEYAQYQIDNALFLAEQIAKEEASIQRQELLDRLGITTDETKLLLGGN